MIPDTALPGRAERWYAAATVPRTRNGDTSSADIRDQAKTNQFALHACAQHRAAGIQGWVGAGVPAPSLGRAAGCARSQLIWYTSRDTFSILSYLIFSGRSFVVW